MFNHDLVTRYKLNRISIDGKRYYVLPDGTKLKSVTTVIDEKSDKKHLNAWKKRVGIEEATKISNIATRRGTAIHTIAENYVLNKDNFYDGAMPNNIVSFKPIKTVLDEHVDNIRGVELGLFSKALKCAGRTDLVGEYDGINSIIDFKTSKKLKKQEWIDNYFIQSTCYSMMFVRLYNIHTPQIVIIITVDNENAAQTFVMDRAKYVQKVLDTFTT